MTAPDPSYIAETVRTALREDVADGDLTAQLIPEEQQAHARVITREDATLCGAPWFDEVFRQLDSRVRVQWHTTDGSRIKANEVLCTIDGPARAILTGERTALNFLQALSGTATITRKYVDAADGRITILDTRKTTPTLRALEKYAVRAGGGTNHRHGLHDAVLIKDNHIRLAGGVRVAVERMRAAQPDKPIEIEAQDLDQVDEAIAAGADIVLLDNMETEMIREAVKRIAGRAKVEISGGITLERIPELAATGADYVSVGALTHSAPAADLSLEIEPDA